MLIPMTCLPHTILRGIRFVCTLASTGGLTVAATAQDLEPLKTFYDKNYKDPDPVQLVAALEEKSHREVALQLAQRLHVSDWHSDLPEFISSNRSDLQLEAVRCLIYQGLTDHTPRKLLHSLLKDRDEDVRDLMGEVFRLWGTPEDLDVLRAAVRIERNPFVKASYMAAGKAILQRGDSQPVPEEWKQLQRETPYEPTYLYGRGFLSPGVEDSEAVRQAAKERVLLKRRLAGYPDVDFHADTSPPPEPAIQYFPPIDGYFRKKRESYGYRVSSQGGPFANSVHIGDDCGWREPGRTVVAISSGTVVHLREAARSWGGLVILEHELPSGKKFCSLYAHLGPAIPLQPGERVSAGQKLGTIGRTHTWEGGGYVAHLHFSIYEGGFDSPDAAPGDWITGYLGYETFDSGDHHWVDPVAFLKRVVPPSLQR
ncbi:MAG: peptidoglycan DD-metalloendopeptidase family protein [Kiritimatiellia bacterium]